MATQVNREAMSEWITNHWAGDKTCPICTRNTWAVSEDILEMRPFMGGGLATGGHIYPLIAVVCNYCGYSLLFNALVTRMIDKPIDSEPDPAEIESSTKEPSGGEEND